MAYADAYQPDRSLKGKLRRKLVRFVHRRPLVTAPKRPMLSFSFDDAPRTAATTGAGILEARGLRATYYVASGLTDTELPMGRCAGAKDYKALIAAGHELGCHTSGHLDCGKATTEALEADLDANAKMLSRWGERDLESFAYPYGDVAARAKALLGERFSTVRALHHGVIEKGSDLNQLPAVGIEGADGEDVARRWMQTALAKSAWLILFTHDVRPEPSPWGCMPQTLARLADEAMTAGFEILTVRDAARKLHH
jgi:peptidoglycan/xylan/chitin deacetylase (PgdA/CDA1 family)